MTTRASYGSSACTADRGCSGSFESFENRQTHSRHAKPFKQVVGFVVDRTSAGHEINVGMSRSTSASSLSSASSSLPPSLLKPSLDEHLKNISEESDFEIWSEDEKSIINILDSSEEDEQEDEEEPHKSEPIPIPKKPRRNFMFYHRDAQILMGFKKRYDELVEFAAIWF